MAFTAAFQRGPTCGRSRAAGRSRAHGGRAGYDGAGARLTKREVLQSAGLATALMALGAEPWSDATAATAPKGPPKPITSSLCDADCEAALGARTQLPSGLEYQDIKVGSGPTPVRGFQVTVNYVAMTAEGRAFDDSVQKATPYDIRYGAESVIPGLDEGLKSMKPGGIRRLYIPGSLSFPKGLPAAAGRARVPPNSPVVFDVQLLFIPGFEDEE